MLEFIDLNTVNILIFFVVLLFIGIALYFIAQIGLLIVEFRKDKALMNEEYETIAREVGVRNNHQNAMSTVLPAAVSGVLIQTILDDNHIDQATEQQMREMDGVTLAQFAMDHNFINQEQLTHLMMDQGIDPYTTPGVDILVDEGYHHIDHGLGIANPDHHNDNM